jgi:uncharacterized protein DUF6152
VTFLTPLSRDKIVPQKLPIKGNLLKSKLAALCAIAFLASGSASAHHGVAWYDYSKTVTASKVTVTAFEWSNPHCKIYFDTTDDRKVVRHWIVEMHPPNALLEHGWTRQALHSGDVISLRFRPAKNHTNAGLLDEVTLPNGVTLRQNVLLLPPGQVMSIEEWTRKFASKAPGVNLSPTQSEPGDK